MPESPRRNLTTLLERSHPAPSIVACLTVLGALLRVAAARQDLFADELATYWIVTEHDLRGVIDTVWSTAEITPPLSFVLSWVTAHIGHSAFWIRLPAFVAGIATIPLVWTLGRRTVGGPAALVAAAVTALSPFTIVYSAEARGYGVLMGLITLSTLALVRALSDNQRRWWCLYALAVALAMYTHYTSVFVIAVQALWALWRHADRRKRIVLANVGAAAMYVPWLTGLRADLDSPTTGILSAFYPLGFNSTWRALARWSAGLPHDVPGATLADVPGTVPALMLLAAVILGVAGLFLRQAPDPSAEPRSGNDEGVGTDLIVLLAVATPIGAFAQSVIGTNVFNTRSLAASWPYLALGVAALVTRAPARRAAIPLLVIPFAIAAATMFRPEYVRPEYGVIARFADEGDAAVVVNAAGFPPGPLTQLDVAGNIPAAPVLRLFIPEQMDRPFAVGDPIPDPEEQMARAVAMADGGNIVVVYIDLYRSSIESLLDSLPDQYRVTESIERDALAVFDLRAVLLERADG